MSNENEPATKKDLAELSTDFTTKLSSMEKRLVVIEEIAADFTAKQTSMEKRLLLEMGRVANVMIEQIGAKVAVIDDKHDGPVRQLRVDLDAHCADSALHMRPAPLAPKRAIRRKSLRTR